MKNWKMNNVTAPDHGELFFCGNLWVNPIKSTILPNQREIMPIKFPFLPNKLPAMPDIQEILPIKTNSHNRMRSDLSLLSLTLLS